MTPGLLQRLNLGRQDFKTDDGFTTFLSRELEATAIKILQTPLANLPLIGGAVLPINTSIPDGAESFTYVVEDGNGQARWEDDYASGNLPNVDVVAEEFQQPIREFGDHWQISRREMRASAFAGRGDLGQKKAARALRAMNEFAEYVGMFGDTTRGLQGFATHNNVPIVAPVFDGAGDASWLTKEGDLIQADIVNMQQQVIDVTNGSRSLSRIMVPLNIWTSWNRPYQVTGATNIAINSKSIREFIVDANPDIQFGSLLRLQSTKSAAPPLTPDAPTTLQLASDRIVAYTNTDEVLEFVQPMAPRFYPPQWYELRMKTPGTSTTGGTVFYEPFACCYMDSPPGA